MDRPKSSRDKLKKKLKDKKAQRTGESTNNLNNLEDDTDIFSMINQVQSILKNNPEMVSKVSSCVNSLMANPEIMEKLHSQIGHASSQTLQSNSSGESSQADSNES